jgi:hypothetical protein
VDYQREVCNVRHLKFISLLIAVGALVWGCVEELGTGENKKPNAWFVRAPENNTVIFQNSADFEWMATDFDDDLGMGASYVNLEPSYVEWENLETGEIVKFEHPGGWVRVYENNYEIVDLPDSNFVFSVMIQDGRGADSTITRRFIVRFDDLPPIIDHVNCPVKPPKIFTHRYLVEAHDVARSARAATPPESLEFWYKFVGPPGTETYEPGIEWAYENREFEVTVDGQSNPGKYTFWYKVRDRAGNPTEQKKCEFTIEK